MSIKFEPNDAQGSPIQYYYADYAMTPAAGSPNVAVCSSLNIKKKIKLICCSQAVVGTTMIPAGNQTVNITLPAYNGWKYDISLYAVNAINASVPANLSFVIAVAPRYFFKREYSSSFYSLHALPLSIRSR